MNHPQGTARKVALLLSKCALLTVLGGLTMQGLFVLAQRLEQQYYTGTRYSWVDKLRPEVLVMGSSTVLYGVDDTLLARELGLPHSSVATIAEHATHPKLLYHDWLNIHPQPGPRMVLIGLDPWLVTMARFHYDNFTSCLFTLNERLGLFLYPHPEVRRSQLFSGQAVVGTIESAVKHAHYSDSLPSTAFGATEMREALNFTIAPELYFGKNRRVYYKPFFDDLRKLKDSIEASGATVCFVLPPKRKVWYEGYKQNCRALDSEFVALFNARVGPVRLLGSFRDPAPELDTLYFADDVHLKPEGRTVFTKKLAGELPSVPGQTPRLLRPLWDY